MKMKSYTKATETNRYEYHRVMEKTNCTDKVNGHSYEWIFKKHPEHKAIAKQFPQMYGIPCKCTKCGKVTSSM